LSIGLVGNNKIITHHTINAWKYREKIERERFAIEKKLLCQYQENNPLDLEI
jgi:hypothetical protein